MLKNICNLPGVVPLSRKQLKSINGAGTTCKATCGDGSIVVVGVCPALSSACSGYGVTGCSCGHKSPFDPPGFV